MSATPTDWTERVRQALAHRYLGLVCVVLGCVIASPALSSGLLADDVGQRAFILAQLAGGGDRPWWDMFVLVGASTEELEKLRYLGQVPWWTSTHVHIAFWRPLTAATHYLDYALWPDSPWLMHLHQLLWRGTACGLAWALFRRLASTPAAGGAAGLGFALTHLHMSAAVWLAHRNAVLVVVCGLVCLLAHDRWRRDAWRYGAGLGPLAFGLALLAGEMGVAVLGFVLAYALVLDTTASPSRRLASVVPYLLVLIAWRMVYDSLGYGAVGSGLYLDPLAEPSAWLSSVPRRITELSVYLLGPPGEIGRLLTWRGLGAALIGSVLVLAAWTGPSSTRRVLAFAGLGLVLSLIPVTTTAAHDRVLVVATIGSVLAFGEAIDLVLGQSQTLLRAGAALIVLVHYVVSPAAGVWLATHVQGFKVSGDSYPIAASLDDDQLRRQSLVVLHTPDLLYATLLPVARQARGLNRPNFSWVLHAEPDGAPTVRQLDARTLELHDPRGWLRGPDSRLLRGPNEPFAVGDQVRTLDYTLTVLEVDEGRPLRVSVQLRAPMGDPTLALVTWHDGDFVAWAP